MLNDFYVLKIDTNNNLDDIIITQANAEKKQMQDYYNSFDDGYKYIVFYTNEFTKLNFILK